MDHLPFVLLGLRTAVREVSGCSPSDLLYGTHLRLPGDCLTLSSPSVFPPASDFVANLRGVLRSVEPMPVVHHGVVPARVDPALLSASHVFLRVDSVKRPLVPPYDGPFRVLERGAKTYVLDKNNKSVTVSIDRLKPAYFLPGSLPPSSELPVSSADSLPSLIPAVAAPASPRPSPASPRSSGVFTRSGRQSRPATHFQA